MEITQAQQDVRTVYRGGGVGALVSAVVWALAAAIGQWVEMDLAVVVLFVGGALIFPIGSLVLRLLGGPSTLPSGHPMIGLAMQVAFIVPIGVILAALVFLERPEWFFSFAACVVGAHYLPFMFLYGMKEYGVLAAVLVVLGLGLAFEPQGVTTAAWITAGVELAVSPLLLRRGR